MLVMAGVRLALRSAASTCLDAGQEHRSHQFRVSHTPTAHDPSSGSAYIGAVEIEADDAAAELLHVLLQETGISAHGADAGALEAFVHAVDNDLIVTRE